MKKSLLLILSLIAFVQADAQKQNRILSWSIGEVELTRGETVKAHYPLLVVISNEEDAPQLGTSTLRLFYDAGLLEGLQIENIENGYDISGLNESKNVFGDVFGFAGGGGIFAQFDLMANRMDPLDLSVRPIHVLDFTFSVLPGANIPLCAALVLDNNEQINDKKKGKDKDAGYLKNDSGIVGTYFLNSNTNKVYLADDEVTHFLWEDDPLSDHLVDQPEDKAGAISRNKSRSCLNFKTPIPSSELVDFKAFKKEGKQVLLNWITDSEFNNDYFEIQRSEDGFSFESLGRIEGQWNALTSTAYDFLDVTAIDGTNHYRLMQVDNNGNTEYSAIRTVQFEAEFSPEDIRVAYYPNPSKGIVNILSSKVFTNFDLLIFDVQGRLVMERLGVNSEEKLDLSGLQAGAYTLTLKNPDRQIVSSQSIVIAE